MTLEDADLVFEPFAPGPHDERPAIFAERRERGPIHHTSSDLWVLPRFDDVKAVLARPDLFSSRPNPYAGTSVWSEYQDDPAVIERLLEIASGLPLDLDELANTRAIAGADPPQHTRMRRIVSRGFTAPRIAEMASAIDTIVGRCLNRGHHRRASLPSRSIDSSAGQSESLAQCH